MLRNRTFNDQANVVGTRWFYNYGGKPVITSRSRGSGPYGTSQDVIGNFPRQNALELIRTHFEPAILDGAKWVGSTKTVELSTYPSDYTPVASPINVKYADLTALQKNNYGIEVLSRTNLSNAHVNIPQALAELKDLPTLIKDWGGNLLKKASKGYISWRWAVAPMISDLRALADFTSAVDRRVKQLEQLREVGFVRKKVKLQEDTSFGSTVNTYVHSTDATWRAPRTILYTNRVWGTCKWKPAPGLQLPKTADGLRKLAYGLTFGINAHSALATMWELAPWSWFIDWFVGVGDFIAAHNNTIPCVAEACIMQTKTASAVWGAWITPPNWGSCTYPVEYWSKKLRFVVSPTGLLPSLDLPFLDGRKWAILGALSALKDPANARSRARK